MSNPIVIVSAARTPMGAFQGDFASLSAHDLGGFAIKAAMERSGISSDLVNEVLFGNCLMAGQGQAPARQAAFKGGLLKGDVIVKLGDNVVKDMQTYMQALAKFKKGDETTVQILRGNDFKSYTITF